MKRTTLSGALIALLLCTARVCGAVCAGDCDGGGAVTVDELVSLVNIALEQSPLALCSAGDADQNSTISIDEIVTAVGYALGSCPPPEQPCAQRNALRNLYFGDLHVHTTLSFDAYLWDTRATPVDAYRFARGESISLPPLDAQGHGTRPVQLDRPLDFAAVTDHSEFLGEIETCITPGSPSYESQSCALVRAGSPQIYADLGARMIAGRPRRIADICGSDGAVCRTGADAVWQRVQAAAAQAYQPCDFTSFVAYEYSRSPGASTMHRNVIFRSEIVPSPISAFEQPTPAGLWTELKTACADAGSGCDVLAIPHNSNESNGNTFKIESALAASPTEQRAQAALRARMEPLVEIFQHKGNSECLSGLSGIVGSDEACDFEEARTAPFDDCGDGTGQLGATGLGCVSRNDYVRFALLGGLQEEERLGVNPLRLGFIGSTDTHNGTPGFTDEWSFRGHQGITDADPAVLLGAGDFAAAGLRANPGGLAALWAEENQRGSLFDALRRRETYATSGTRISLRVFGGWDLPEDLCTRPDMVQVGYQRGVPMGGVLPRTSAAVSPVFVVSALRDAGSASHPGTALQRVEIIKGWLDGDVKHHRAYPVAGDFSSPADVDLDTCTPRGPGFDSFCSVWRDPDFDPAQRAFYVVRVMENPSCRWSTWLCNTLPLGQRPEACADPTVRKTIQERAWTSPIWYAPPLEPAALSLPRSL